MKTSTKIIAGFGIIVILLCLYALITHSSNSLLRGFDTTTTTGGLQEATTTNGNETLAASDMAFQSIVSSTTITNAALTVTLPASSTLTSLVPTVGSFSNFTFCNATTTAEVTITLAGNTGTILRSATSTLIVYPGKCAQVYFYRPATTTPIIIINQLGFLNRLNPSNLNF